MLVGISKMFCEIDFQSEFGLFGSEGIDVYDWRIDHTHHLRLEIEFGRFTYSLAKFFGVSNHQTAVIFVEISKESVIIDSGNAKCVIVIYLKCSTDVLFVAQERPNSSSRIAAFNESF